jgi:two-component system phosphate regulon sensor histidine kinase PhoR
LRTIASSFRARLVVGYVLIAAVFALAWVSSLYTPLTQAALHQQTRTLTAVARAGALVTSETSATPAALASQIVTGTDLRLTIVASDGHVLADSQTNPSTMENHASRPEIAAALAGRTGSDLRVSKTQGIEELYVAVPASFGGKRVALRVSQPFTEIEAVAARSRRIGLWLLAGALAIAVAIAAWASAAASRPVAALSETAERMAAGSLNVEVPDVPGDLQVLADALTTLGAQMRSRIDALVAEQRTLRTTLDGLTDAVFLLESETIRYANGAASRLFRAPTGGWRRVALENAGLPESLLGSIREALTGSEPRAIDLDPDPRGRTLRLLVVPLDGINGVRRAIAVVSDVTQRARLDRMRRDFVANASHELKTPVAGIQLLAESAETASSDGDVEMALRFTRQIEAEAARLKHLVSDLLDLSRLESEPEPGAITDVRSAVDNAILSHRAAAGRKAIDVASDMSEVRGVDVFAATDPTDIAIALDNLIDNALAYTETGSVRVSVKVSDAMVTVRVTDTGPGIAPEHLPRIFERFYRVDRARSRDSGGTGLGLALVKHVIERSGGTVSVESVVGTGTTFTLRLPRAV